MKTEILSKNQIKKAAELIREGNIVAFPTETVYGLGANALDKKAIKKIFEVKGRPIKNPLIVHIASKEQLHSIAKVKRFHEEVDKLIRKFWPGPLTLVLERKKNIHNEVTGGLNTVAVRMPNNKVALKLIKNSGVPIAAPSANLSGKPSGTCFKHVFEDFNGKIACIIKSRNCKIGLESTVIDLTSKKPLLLRPGGTDLEELKEILPDLRINNKKIDKVKSPGMKYKHYSPKAKVILFEKNAKKKIEGYKKIFEDKKVKIIKTSKTKSFAKKLFKIFRDADKEGVDVILLNSIDEKGIGLPIMNRLRKAASEIVQ